MYAAGTVNSSIALWAKPAQQLLRKTLSCVIKLIYCACVYTCIHRCRGLCFVFCGAAIKHDFCLHWLHLLLLCLQVTNTGYSYLANWQCPARALWPQDWHSRIVLFTPSWRCSLLITSDMLQLLMAIMVSWHGGYRQCNTVCWLNRLWTAVQCMCQSITGSCGCTVLCYIYTENSCHMLKIGDHHSMFRCSDTTLCCNRYKSYYAWSEGGNASLNL